MYGKTFSIPDHHYAFTRRSKMEPRRRSLMEQYRRHYAMRPDPDPSADETGVQCIRNALQRIRVTLCFSPTHHRRIASDGRGKFQQVQ